MIYINYCADCGPVTDKAARKLVFKGLEKKNFFLSSLVKDRAKWDEKAFKVAKR